MSDEPYLRRGAQGEWVQFLQQSLAYYGYDPGSPDGIFGSLTDGEVRSYQGDNGLAPDGVVGPLTWDSLRGQPPRAGNGFDESFDDAEAQALAEQIATEYGLDGWLPSVRETGPVFVDLVFRGDIEEQAHTVAFGDDIRRECAPKGCPLSLVISSDTFALVGCGDGTCPTCPKHVGNLFVKHWCAYRGVHTDLLAILFITTIPGLTMGPYVFK